MFTVLVAFVHDAKKTHVPARIWLDGFSSKFAIEDFLVRLSVGDILPSLQKDETPLNHILSQMSVCTTRVISTTTNLYQKWLTIP